MQNIDLLAERLKKNNCKYSFGITGGGPSLSLIKALKDQDIKFINATHECAATIMAGAYTRSSNNLGVSISIKGPGLANSYAGICFNNYENIPTISISESYPDGVESPKMHKRLDHKLILKPVTKALGSSNIDENQFNEIIEISRKEIPGPLHINLSEDKIPVIKNQFKKNKGLIYGNNQFIEEKIKRCKRPVLILGESIKRLFHSDLFEELRIPILTTVACRGIVSETSNFSAGPYTGEGKEISPEKLLLDQSDLVIFLGVSATELTELPAVCNSFLFLEPIDCANYKLNSGDHINIDREFTYDVIQKLSLFNWGANTIVKIENTIENELSKFNWSPYKVYAALNGLDFDYIQVLDTGSFAIIAEHILKATKKRRYFGASNSRFMGTAIPSSIGIALANPQEPIICIFGDGGFRAYPYEMLTAKLFNLPIVFIYMCDSHYASIVSNAGDRYTKEALKLETKNVDKLAKSMAINTFCCNELNSFDLVLKTWDKNSPIFIQCIFENYKEYTSMTEGIR